VDDKRTESLHPVVAKSKRPGSLVLSGTQQTGEKRLSKVGPAVMFSALSELSALFYRDPGAFS
jgi:hypothetical protein